LDWHSPAGARVFVHQVSEKHAGDSAAARTILAEHMHKAHRLMRMQETVLTQRFLPEGKII